MSGALRLIFHYDRASFRVCEVETLALARRCPALPSERYVRTTKYAVALAVAVPQQYWIEEVCLFAVWKDGRDSCLEVHVHTFGPEVGAVPILGPVGT